ncbi:MAG: hypothetical protein AUJ20_01580 [Comamonadaceae bacterium CG1_02_60_18]|nr:MAG: hypothetical protein AUJ20_01580 [Comamonadaceae bacterium CG1_02_60_18]
MRWLTLASALVVVASPALAAKTYTVNSDGTVTDPTTGLTWKRCAEGQTWSGTTCSGTAATYNWATAKALTSTFAGQSDWRLPNIRELQSIVDRTVSSPAIDVAAFPFTPKYSDIASDFWSSTVNFSAPSESWYVNFIHGNADAAPTTISVKFYVRLVRGGQPLGLLDITRPDADYIDQGDGTVLHTPTGLTWQRCAQGQSWINGTCSGTLSPSNWATASASINTYAGHADWRLPTEEELASLVDYSRFAPAINATMFPHLPITALFWSSTPLTAQASWYLNFKAGNVNTNTNFSGLYVRWVRGGRSFGPLALSVSKTGAGQVATSVLPGIECGAVCQSGYYAGEVVTLNASPATNLIAWGGACASAGAAASCTVTMDAAKSVSASFKDTPMVAGLPTSLAFSSANLRSIGTAQVIALRNTGTAALNISSIVVASGEFAQTHTCLASLAAGATCNISVTFEPTLAGSQNGALLLVSDALDSPHSVSLAGTAVATAADAPTDVSAIAGNAQASVSFTAPMVNGGAAVSKYTVTASPGGRTGIAASSPITVTGLTNDVSYTFMVTAFNGAGTSVASVASNSVVPLRDSQSISFGPAPTLLFGATATVTATAATSCAANCPTVRNAITFSSTTPTVCSVTTGGRVSALSMGDCGVAADQAINAYYSAAPQATLTIAVGQAPQSISFGAVPVLKLGGSGQLSATGGQSGNALVFSSTTPTICTVTGSTVTDINAGDCVVAVDQAASTHYSAAPQVTQKIVVSPAPQSISFGAAPTLVVDATGTVTATGGASGNGVVFSSVTPSICAVTGSTVSALAAGNCAVAANQAANANYLAAPQTLQWIVVGAGTQSISFGTAPALVAGGQGVLAATGGASGNAVTFSSTTHTVCTVAGNTVTAVKVGDCLVAANQAGNANYGAAAQVTQLITIGKGLALLSGWNLLGNTSDQPVAVAALLSDTTLVTTVWKWDASKPGWQFYTPSMDTNALQDYATSKGYAALTVLNPGDGFWVNAKRLGNLVDPFVGQPYTLGAAQLKKGWNLVATAANVTPAALNQSLTDTLNPPPTVGTVPLNLTSLWAWDNSRSKWYFYAPNLQAQGGTELLNYAASKGYLDFTASGKRLDDGTGFWVNKP